MYAVKTLLDYALKKLECARIWHWCPYDLTCDATFIDSVDISKCASYNQYRTTNISQKLKILYIHYDSIISILFDCIKKI